MHEWQKIGAEGKVERFVNPLNTRQFRDVINQVRIHDPSRTLLDGGDLRIEHPLCKATGKKDHILIADKAELRAVIEINVGGTWVEFSRSQKGSEDSVKRSWLYDSLSIQFDANGKWSFTFVAPAAGVYRLRLNITASKRTPVQTYTSKTGTLYRAEWDKLAFSWFDMAKDVSIATPTDRGVEIISAPVSLANLETKVWDPSFSDDADWGAEVRPNAKFPNDGSDFCGGNAGADSYRVANKFTITTLPTTATVNQVDFQINVSSVGSAGALLWDIDGYNGTGQGDPETDSAAVMYAACAITGVYVNDTTQFRTTGSKTFTDLGATANADMEAARDAGNTFSVAIRETTDTTSTARCEFSEYTQADPPTLTITYTEAGGGGEDRATKQVQIPDVSFDFMKIQGG